MKNIVMTQRELLRETGLTPRRLQALEKAMGLRPRKAYTLAQCKALLLAAQPALKKPKA